MQKYRCQNEAEVRKILITAGAFTTEEIRRVQSLHDEGKSIDEIMRETGLKKASVYAYLPFQKGMYNCELYI